MRKVIDPTAVSAIHEPKRIAVSLQLLTEGDLSNKFNTQMRTKDYKKDMMMVLLIRLSRCKQIIDTK